MSAQGSRWLNTHSKKSDCKKAHKDALIAFKQRKTVAQPDQPAQIISAPSSSIDALWNRIKVTSNYKELCIQKEENAKQYHNDDSDMEDDFVFDTAEGIFDLLHDAAIYKKQIDKYKNALSNHESQQEQAESQAQTKIFDLESMISTMKYNTNSLAAEYTKRIEALEEEIRTQKSL